MTSEPILRDFSPGQLISGMQVCSVFWAVISAFGIVANILNIKSFISMRMTDGMTVSFLIMSIIDLKFLLVSMALSFSTGFYVLETISDFWLELIPYNIGLYFANLIVPLSAITSLQTGFIAIARCLCVAAPFYFKGLLTRKISLAIMVFFIVGSLIIYVPVFIFMGVSEKFDLRRNVSRPSVWVSANREPIKNVVWTMLAMVIPLVSQVVVIISLIVLAKALKDSKRFRMASSSVGYAQKKSETDTSAVRKLKIMTKDYRLSGKDMQIVQQVALISMVHIICQTPKIMFIITGIVLPEFNYNRALHNFYLTMSNTRLIFEMINSAVTKHTAMEYTENAKMLMGYVSHEDSKETNILDYDDSKQDFSSSSDDESTITDDQIYPETKQDKITWHEQIRMMQLRSHINQLLNEVKQAQYIADKTREELKKCKTQIKLFEEERDKLFVEIKEKETENNRSAIDRLCATHECVCKELEAEQRLEAVIMEKLDQAEYDLARAELERGKFILAEDDLLQRELKLSEEKAEMAMIRHQKEQFLAQQALAMKQKENKIKTKATLEAEKRHRHAVEEAEKSHNRANKYLSKTMAKLKMRQEEEAERYKIDMNRKMEMLLKLREDIAHNKENLRAIKAKDKASEDKKKAAEELEREKILSEGGNPDHALLVKKRKNEMEKLKQQFEADQQVKKVEIVQKILREEENLKKKKKLQPYLWEWPDREKSLRVPPKKPKIPKLLQDFIAADDDVCASKENLQSKFESTMPLNDKGKQLNKNMPLPEIAAVVPNVNENNFNRSADFDEDILAMTSFDKGEEDYIGTEDEGEGEEYGEEHFEEMGGEEHEEELQTVISQAKMSDSESEIEEEEPQMDLAQPEFEGLWNKQTKPYKLPKGTDQPQLTHPGLSKMEEEILKRTLEKTRRGIVTTQVAAGKEFKGPAFYSKPDIIHFKDFDVGKLYKKKVKITNVSYTLNFIKFIDISDQLKDFIKIQFDPPGHMSAGLTCDLMVIFKPMINEDLHGKVKFLTQTGPFEIPLICSTKKCNLSIDLDTIDFGTHVIGETIKRKVTLTNRGALGTSFTFSKVSVPPMPITAKLKSSEESNVELEIKSSEMNESKSAASALGKISETSEVLPQQTNMISVTRLSSHQISVSQLTNQNPASQAPSSQNDLQNEGPSLQLLYPSTSGRVDNSLSEKPPSTVMLGETNTPEPVTTEHLTYENNETVTEVNNTTTDTPFKKGGISFSVSKQDTPAESQDWEDYCSIDGMTVGNIAYQELGPFSSVKLEIIWKPKISGKVNVDFEITFSDPLSNPLSLEAIGTAIDVPVWVKRQCVDLQTCILDRLYQDTVIVCNRASTALRLKFEVAPELKDHMEILPKTGYIQAQSQFSAQLKFLPRKSIYSDAPAFIEKEIGVLEAPVTIRVTDQTTPVVFTVQAVVTNSDIEISESQIDFGFCTIHESVVKRIELSNKSILPQHFGFVGLPEFVEVQPNDGFGTLLPLEKLSLDIIFSPKKAEEFKFELVCRTLINRDFKISCVGTGVHTPLELSKQVIHFGATSLFDKATTYLHVINNHVSANEFSHPVPRIGKGKICPVGPTSFHFIVPNDAPVSISPIVGTVQPGKRCKINVQFTPVLGDKEIKEEAEKMMEKEKMKENKIETMIKESIDPIISAKTPGKEKSTSNIVAQSKIKMSASNVSVVPEVVKDKLDSESLNAQSPEYIAATSALIRHFRGRFQTFTIPCYIASGTASVPGELDYSVHNTLYLQIHCPAVKPPLLVISDGGKNTLNFGNVSIGQTSQKSITIQNISDKYLELKSTLVNPAGPFLMLNALRPLSPGATHTILMTFTPEKSQIFQENFCIKSSNATLNLTLKGYGVSPLVNLSFSESVFDMGAVLSGEFVEKTFMIENTSILSIDYIIKQDSISLYHNENAHRLQEFLHLQTANKTKKILGTQNFNGKNVFDIVPMRGTIAGGGSQEITVTFAPDHESDLYADGVRVELFDEEGSHFFKLIGQGKSKMMYMEGYDQLIPSQESLVLAPYYPEDEDPDGRPNVQPSPPALITIKSMMLNDSLQPGSRTINVGCVRTMAVSQKKNGEFSVDGLQSLIQKGFTVEPQKGMVEAGIKKPVVFTWTPPANHDPNVIIEETATLTLKCDGTEQITLMIQAMVVTG
ncbi:Cilia- and flagella-associated protein 74 [Bulinus truncatus]|nr:Cilia- and flagella-associated protein 74 [Bulinus truncatus]